MSAFIDLTGQIINGIEMLKFVSFGPTKFLCKCYCGKEFIANRNSLVAKLTQSCGCLHRAKITVHGETKTRFYQCWRDLRQRCYSVNNAQFKNYGGRGITFCDRWKDYLLFKEDMLAGYAEHLTIDRIDHNGNYEKSNCRWVTMKEQMRNLRKNRFIETPTGPMILRDIANKTGLNYNTLRFRLINENNITYERLTRPPGKYVKKS